MFPVQCSTHAFIVRESLAVVEVSLVNMTMKLTFSSLQAPYRSLNS